MLRFRRILFVSLTIMGFLLISNNDYNLGTELPDNTVKELSSPNSSDGGSMADSTSDMPCGSYSNAATMAALNNARIIGSIITVNWKAIEPSD
jgi:hypothetical protein